MEITGTQESEKIDTSELLRRLDANENGLTTEQVETRREQFGRNEIVEEKQNRLLKLLHYFWGPIPFMIELAMVLSAIVNHYDDVVIIGLMLFMNAFVGFYQENKADDAIEKLKQRLAPSARVVRNGEWMQVPAPELVPGDIVRVRPGDIVPADLKLMEGDYLSVDQSALTGESLPVEKGISDIAYQGSNTRMGEMKGLVINTGMNTFFGKTAELVEETRVQSHFEKIIVRIGDYLIALAAVLAVLVFFTSVVRGDSVLETLRFVLVLTVAAIPVALPAVMSVTMAVGAVALAKREAIVSRLSSIEEMAGMDILCSDKTGTITLNELSVGDVKVYDGVDRAHVLIYASLASRAENKDPIDDAIIAAMHSEVAARDYEGLKQVSFKPFDPVSKKTEAEIEMEDGSKFKVSKGAAQVIVKLTGASEELFQSVTSDVDEFATKGYRALAAAKTDESGDWHLIGLIALFDPPRKDSAETIDTAQNMGIDVKMVTGDHVSIAKEMAKTVHLGTNILLPSDFVDVPERKAIPALEKANGFAEVFPEHKHEIVDILQRAGHLVGMTGDGVNDAPALKKADVGIAVQGSTDVAKSAADIVLTQPGLSVIIDAVTQSRRIFQRMANYATYRIAETIRVLLFITISIIVFQFYPVTAIMIVLLALLNDLPIMTIAYDNVKISGKPEQWSYGVVIGLAVFLGIMGVAESFGIFLIGKIYFGLSVLILQSFIYLKLSVAGHLTLLIARTRDRMWSIRPAPILLGAVIATQMIATIITVYGILLPAMGWGLALFVWGYSILLILIEDSIKTAFFRRGGLKILRRF